MTNEDIAFLRKHATDYAYVQQGMSFDVAQDYGDWYVEEFGDESGLDDVPPHSSVFPDYLGFIGYYGE